MGGVVCANDADDRSVKPMRVGTAERSVPSARFAAICAGINMRWRNAAMTDATRFGADTSALCKLELICIPRGFILLGQPLCVVACDVGRDRYYWKTVMRFECVSNGLTVCVRDQISRATGSRFVGR